MWESPIAEGFLGIREFGPVNSENEEQRPRLLCGSSERLIPPEQRFACQQYTGRVIWIYGDAELETVE